jgi:hypothetical protein
MGSLSRFELDRYRRHYSLTTLFETGTLHGHGVQQALDNGFEFVYSVEIMDEFFDKCVERFSANDNVTLLKGHSADMLDLALPSIKGNIFFWLDAHFPGADGGLRDYNSESDETLRCPLETELRIIAKHRRGASDVFLIDDLQIYEEGPFESGGLPARVARPPGANIDFIHELFADSHHIIKLYYDEGYVLLLPIDEMPKIYARRQLRELDGEVGRLLANREE